jgi:hypothetical protein
MVGHGPESVASVQRAVVDPAEAECSERGIGAMGNVGHRSLSHSGWWQVAAGRVTVRPLRFFKMRTFVGDARKIVSESEKII